MSKLKIGVLYSKESKTLPYQTWVEEHLGGDVVLINSRSETVNTDINLLILVGGADVYPLRYNEKPGIKTGQPNIDLEWFDMYMLPQYIELAAQNKLAIFGICRGFQTLNVHFGGSLVQDINQAYSSKDRSELVDDILTCNSNVYQFRNAENKPVLEFKANSLHHQGLYLPQLSNQFWAIGKNKKYDNIEVMIHKELPIAACQFHSEETYCYHMKRLIMSLLNKIQ